MTSSHIQINKLSSFATDLPSYNLSLFKDLNPCRHAPLSVTDYEKWNLKTIGVVGFIHACVVFWVLLIQQTLIFPRNKL